MAGGSLADDGSSQELAATARRSYIERGLKRLVVSRRRRAGPTATSALDLALDADQPDWLSGARAEERAAPHVAVREDEGEREPAQLGGPVTVRSYLGPPLRMVASRVRSMARM